MLHALNLLTASGSTDQFATAVYAELHPATGRVTWAHAGHLPPLVARRSGARSVVSYAERPPQPPLGWPSAGRPREEVLHLGSGDALVLVTDGVVERRGHDLDARLERLRRVVANAGQAGAVTLTERIADSIEPRPEDDCCILVLRRGGSPG